MSDPLSRDSPEVQRRVILSASVSKVFAACSVAAADLALFVASLLPVHRRWWQIALVDHAFDHRLDGYILTRRRCEFCRAHNGHSPNDRRNYVALCLFRPVRYVEQVGGLWRDFCRFGLCLLYRDFALLQLFGKPSDSGKSRRRNALVEEDVEAARSVVIFAGNDLTEASALWMWTVLHAANDRGSAPKAQSRSLKQAVFLAKGRRVEMLFQGRVRSTMLDSVIFCELDMPSARERNTSPQLSQ
jgi:hypothetical protein